MHDDVAAAAGAYSIFAVIYTKCKLEEEVI